MTHKLSCNTANKHGAGWRSIRALLTLQKVTPSFGLWYEWKKEAKSTCYVVQLYCATACDWIVNLSSLWIQWSTKECSRQSSMINYILALCRAPIGHSSVFWKCATELMEGDICTLTTDLKTTLYHGNVLKLVTS